MLDYGLVCIYRLYYVRVDSLTESTYLLTYPIAPLLTRIHLSLLDSRAIRPTITRHRPARQRS